MARRLKVYLAGPEVFLPDAVAIGELKKQLCARCGFAGLYPFDNDVDPTLPPQAMALEIYRANRRLMDEADFGVFNLTPFRGVSADVGTVFELGVFVGSAKPMFAYSNNADDLLARVKRAGMAAHYADRGAWVDRDGLTVEDFSNADNLMIDCSLQEAAATMHRVRSDDPLRDMTGFLACLEDAQRTLAAMSATRRA